MNRITKTIKFNRNLCNIHLTNIAKKNANSQMKPVIDYFITDSNRMFYHTQLNHEQILDFFDYHNIPKHEYEIISHKLLPKDIKGSLDDDFDIIEKYHLPNNDFFKNPSNAQQWEMWMLGGFR